MVAAREVAGAWEAPPLRREATWRSMWVSIQPLGGGIRRCRCWIWHRLRRSGPARAVAARPVLAAAAESNSGGAEAGSPEVAQRCQPAGYVGDSGLSSRRQPPFSLLPSPFSSSLYHLSAQAEGGGWRAPPPHPPIPSFLSFALLLATVLLSLRWW